MSNTLPTNGAAVPSNPPVVSWNAEWGVFIVPVERAGPTERYAGDPAAIVRLGRRRGADLKALWRWFRGLA